MTEVRFYHLQQKRLEQALPEILAKALSQGRRAVVRAGSPARIEALDALLWTYDPAGFLPHGTARDGFEAEQPVFLSTEDGNPNGADVLILTDGAVAGDAGDFALTCEIFDGNDDAAVESARAKWREYAGKGWKTAYFQQDEAGKWEKKQ